MIKAKQMVAKVKGDSSPVNTACKSIVKNFGVSRTTIIYVVQRLTQLLDVANVILSFNEISTVRFQTCPLHKADPISPAPHKSSLGRLGI